MPIQAPLYPSLYLSTIGNAPAFLPGNVRLGHLRDLLVSVGESPRVIGCVIRKANGENVRLSWEGFSIREEDFKFSFLCRTEIPFAPKEPFISLSRDVLDQQIVDMHGKKVVRVNDIRLAYLTSGFFPVAADVGWSGLLRRLGVLDAVHWFLKFFDRSVPATLILWNDMGVLSQRSKNLRLPVSSSKLNRLHPSDLSDIIEDLDARSRQAVFNSLNDEQAADVLVEMEEEARASLVEDLPVERAADVLEQMPSDEVADLLDELDEKQAERLLQRMDRDTSSEVRELMEYEEDTVGALMTTDIVAFPSDKRIGEILDELRRLKPEPYSMYSIFAVDERERLLGVASLPNLVTSDPSAKFASIVEKDTHYLLDTDSSEQLLGMLTKYNLHAVPVVDEEAKLLGMVIIDDVIYRMFRTRRVEL